MTLDQYFRAMRRQLTLLLMATAAWLPAAALAQDSIPWPRGDRLSVSVRARLLVGVGDTVRIGYTVTNAPGSEQPSQAFVVRAFLTEYRLLSPTLWWGSRGVVQDSTAAQWDAMDPRAYIQAGSSLGGFEFAGVGVSDLVAYRVEGHYDLPAVAEADEDLPAQRPLPFWVNSVPGFTVGIVPFPTDSTPGTVLGRLRTLTDRACELNWVAAPMCGSLRGRLDLAQQALSQGDTSAARAHVEGLRNDVLTLTDDAHALLKPNADYALRVWPVAAGMLRAVYLQGSGATANPPTLALSTAAPTATTEKYKDSPAITFAGGNPWATVGTWTATPSVTSGTLTSLGTARVWLGLKNSDDIGTNFDVRLEVQKNGTLIAAGETRCVQGIPRNPASAKDVAVAFGPVTATAFNGTTDVLSLKVLTRIGTTSTGATCGGHSNAVGLRVYFDAVSRAARFDATF